MKRRGRPRKDRLPLPPILLSLRDEATYYRGYPDGLVTSRFAVFFSDYFGVFTLPNLPSGMPIRRMDWTFLRR